MGSPHADSTESTGRDNCAPAGRLPAASSDDRIAGPMSRSPVGDRHRTARPRTPLLEGPFDLAVVGGGINGTGIARDAALRGKSVILLEKDDFAQGTSSRSSKMIHGGIRYLEQARLGLVYESLRERHLLLKLAPHLVRPQVFILPIYAGARRGPRMIRLGLFLYDKLSLGRRPGKCRFLSPAQALERVPALLPEGLLGAGLYYDAVMDDARLVLANAVATVEESSGRADEVVIRNHARVTAIRPGSPCSLTVHDHLTGREDIVQAHCVVKALGPWSDPGRLVPSKGVHIVLPAFPMPDGLLLTHSGDGRVFFLIPWLGRTVIGTTETEFPGKPDDLRVEPGEVAYLLREVQRLFPGLRISSRDILGTFAGIRPLARDSGMLAGRSPGAVSRVHKIIDDGSGVVSVFGGKYTTYRAVAKDVVDRQFPGTECTTHRRALPGGDSGPWEEFRKTLEPETSRHGLPEIERLFRRYGTRLRDVLALSAGDPSLAERLSPAHPETRAEAVYSVRQEFVAYPEDFLARRTAMRYSQDGGRSAYDAVEAILREHAPAVPPDLDAARERYMKSLEWEQTLKV
jgi:glycerol-3-phosphate dehydrogenase